jgi:hypothetical protein
MKRTLIIGIAAVGALWAGTANAGTYITERAESRYIACYNRVYVPAKVLVNTRGKLVKRYSQGWETAGDSWNYVRYPATFIQTSRVVEPDHYTLVGTGCK